jgi:CRP/FNR family cyclic AMP-dependent transcriptional regulator
VFHALLDENIWHFKMTEWLTSNAKGFLQMQGRQLLGLKKNRLLSSLSETQLNIIKERCLWLQYEKGQQIISQNDPSTDVFFVIEGAVRAKSYSPSGREVSFIDIEEGNIFGEFSAIDHQERASSVFALEAGLLARMSSGDFRQTLLDVPEVALQLIELLVAKTRALSDRVFEFSTLPVQGRVTLELLRLAEKSSDDGVTAQIKPAPTHYELATRISTHREAVTRELNHLVDEQIITLHRRRMEVLNLPKLRALVDQALNE